MVGTRGRAINFFMNKFRKLGFIDYKGDLAEDQQLAPERRPARLAGASDCRGASRGVESSDGEAGAGAGAAARAGAR